MPNSSRSLDVIDLVPKRPYLLPSSEPYVWTVDPKFIGVGTGDHIVSIVIGQV